jgi:uncharacterized protein
MKIEVSNIPSLGLEIGQVYEPHILDLDTNDVKISGPVHASAQILKDEACINIELLIKAPAKITCSRCLKEFEQQMLKKVQLDFQIDGQSVIDITKDIREEIIMDYPLKPLCKDDCRGLCSFCGKNLNEGDCNCGR